MGLAEIRFKSNVFSSKCSRSLDGVTQRRVLVQVKLRLRSVLQLFELDPPYHLCCRYLSHLQKYSSYKS